MRVIPFATRTAESVSALGATLSVNNYFIPALYAIHSFTLSLICPNS